MILSIREGERKLARKLTKQFDKTKTYDKFKCNTNYIGALGEIVFDRYLNESDTPHTWVGFKDQTVNNPDFIIGGKTVDIKTTYSDVMWFQQPKHDIYIYAQITPDDLHLVLMGCISKDELEEAITSKTAKKVVRELCNRFDYVIEAEEMDNVRKILKRRLT